MPGREKGVDRKRQGGKRHVPGREKVRTENSGGRTRGGERHVTGKGKGANRGGRDAGGGQGIDGMFPRVVLLGMIKGDM